MTKLLVSGRLTSKGQLTIPVELRNHLSLEEGDRLEFELDEQGNISSIKPRKKRPLTDIMGILKNDIDPTAQTDSELEREAVVRHVVEAYKQSLEKE